MSDAARDLYSFLRSKDFIPSDDGERDDGSDQDDSPSPGLRAVDSFDDQSEESTSSTESAPASSDDTLDFEEDGLGEKLRRVGEDVLNQADFGIVRVDDEGVVQFYNTYESQLAGVEPEQAQGKNFFTQLAPCSNNRIFYGRFKKGVRAGELDERFNYTFTYKMRPTLVDIRLYRDEAGNNWIMVRKR
jgi:photoactive yellow protein